MFAKGLLIFFQAAAGANWWTGSLCCIQNNRTYSLVESGQKSRSERRKRVQVIHIERFQKLPRAVCESFSSMR